MPDNKTHSSSTPGILAKLRKIFGLNIGTVMIRAILIYMIFSVILYLTASHMESYQVPSGPLSMNETYTGLSIMTENVVQADAGGYVTYYAREGTKINANGAVYSLNSSKAAGSGSSLSKEELTDIRSNMQSFSKGFDASKFNSTYSFKYQLNGSILQYASDNSSVSTTSTVNEDGEEVTTTTTKPVETTTTTTTAKSETQTTTTATSAQPESEPLFTHKQGDADFNSETSLQFGFKLSDYITDYSQHYNVKVNVKSSGNASGAVGALVDGSWSAQSTKLTGGEETQWIYSDLDPSRTSDEVFVQLYYLKANADFQIASVEVTPVKEAVDTSAVTKVTAAEPKPADDTTTTTTTTASTEPKADENTQPESTTTTAARQPANVGAAVTTVSEGDSSQELTESQATEKIQQIVDEASSQADSSKVNPSTGVEMTKNILTVIAAGYVIFAIFAVIFNRFAAKDEE